MRLGAPVFNWTNAEEWALRHIEKGYGAAYWPLPADASPAQEEAFISAANAHDLVIAEVGIWNNLLDPNAQKQEVHIRCAITR